MRGLIQRLDQAEDFVAGTHTKKKPWYSSVQNARVAGQGRRVRGCMERRVWGQAKHEQCLLGEARLLEKVSLHGMRCAYELTLQEAPPAHSVETVADANKSTCQHPAHVHAAQIRLRLGRFSLNLLNPTP